jgi:hypothetical protein
MASTFGPGGEFDPNSLPDPTFVVPDLMEAVEGWRVWSVPVELPLFGADIKLRSATHTEYEWTPRRTCRAHCPKPHRPAASDCDCGFYSAKSFEHLMTMPYHHYNAEAEGRVCVLGRVANWGQVTEGTQGWRSEYSYPVKLWIPFETPHLLKPIKDAYGVPVSMKNVLKPHEPQAA